MESMQPQNNRDEEAGKGEGKVVNVVGLLNQRLCLLSRKDQVIFNSEFITKKKKKHIAGVS